MKFNKLVPELSVSNMKKSLSFYTKILGFKVEYARKESKFAFLALQGSQIMIQQINPRWETAKLSRPFGRGVNLQMEVKSIRHIINSLNKNDWPLFEPVQENWYRKGKHLLGCRELLVQDPDGYLLRFSQDLGTKHI